MILYFTGTGNSLYVAQQLGGEIVLESEPNVKTTFTVKLHKCFF